MAKSAVISAKVTPDIAAAIKAQARVKGKTVSALISDYAVGVDQTIIQSSTGISVPGQTLEDIQRAATVIGGSAFVGILSYKTIKAALLDSKRKGEIRYTESQIEGFSVLFGIAGAIVTGVGIINLMKDVE